MGWYVTCEICGHEEKYGLGCNCYQEETKRNIARMVACRIDEAFIRDDHCWTILVQKLQPLPGTVFYMRTCLSDGGGEYSCWRKVLEITEEEFLNYKNQEATPRLETDE